MTLWSRNPVLAEIFGAKANVSAPAQGSAPPALISRSVAATNVISGSGGAADIASELERTRVRYFDVWAAQFHPNAEAKGARRKRLSLRRAEGVKELDWTRLDSGRSLCWIRIDRRMRTFAASRIETSVAPPRSHARTR
jgi:hypothetical protein